MKIQILLLCAFFLNACVQMKSESAYMEKVNQELGDDVQRLSSPEGTYTLFFSKDSVSNGQELVKFIVVENETEKSVYQDTLPNTSLSWHSDFQLLLEQQLGILQKEVSGNGVKRFLLNPSTGRKTMLPQNTNSH